MQFSILLIFLFHTFRYTFLGGETPLRDHFLLFFYCNPMNMKPLVTPKSAVKHIIILCPNSVLLYAALVLCNLGGK